MKHRNKEEFKEQLKNKKNQQYSIPSTLPVHPIISPLPVNNSPLLNQVQRNNLPTPKTTDIDKIITPSNERITNNKNQYIVDLHKN